MGYKDSKKFTARAHEFWKVALTSGNPSWWTAESILLWKKMWPKGRPSSGVRFEAALGEQLLLFPLLVGNRERQEALSCTLMGGILAVLYA